MSTGHSASQRPQLVQLVGLDAIWMGDILLKIVNAAPNGQRYLHEKRWMNMEVRTNKIKTPPKRGVFQ